MGAWFANFLSENGYEIILNDKKTATARHSARKKGFRFVKDPTRAAQLSQIVLLATPTHATKSLLKRVTSTAPKAALIVEMSSVKQPIRKTIQSLTQHGTQIMSIHPMFGPGTTSLTGKSIIVAQEPRNCAAASKLISMFVKKGGRIIRSNLEDHDKLVATTLALPHLMNFAFIETIRKTGLPLHKVRELGGTTFKLQLLIAETLQRENSKSEASILAENIHNDRTFATFVQQIKQVRDIIRSKPEPELLRRLRDDAAYVRKDRLFRTAHERFVAAVEASTPR